MIQLPDFRQQESYACGKVMLQVICSYYDKPLPLFIANLSNAVSGLSPDSLAAGFRSLGFKLLEGNWTIDLLKAVTKGGKPVCCLTQLEGVGHWICVSSVSRGRVWYQCPETGPTSQKIEEFEKNWIDYHYVGGVFDRWAVCPYL